MELSHVGQWSTSFLLDTDAPSDFFTTEVNQALENERCMWQRQNECGFLHVTYDPVTGERIHVALNDLQARLLGMHRDELVSRFKAHDEPLRIPPQDLLLLIADDALRGFADGPRFLRIFLSETRAPALVCVSTQRSHDAAGRLIAVRARKPPPPSSPPSLRPVSRESSASESALHQT